MDTIHVQAVYDCEGQLRDEGLERLRRQYLQMVPYRDLTWPSGDRLKSSHVQRFLYNHVLSAEGPAAMYKSKILKHIIESIESAITDPEEDEVIEELYSEFTESLSHTRSDGVLGQIEPQESIVVFNPPCSLLRQPDVSFQSAEMTNAFSFSGGTGHRTWEASLHLGSFLCTERGRLLTRNKNVLELGAGRGLVSYLCCSYLEAKQVFPTDGDINCVEKMKIHSGPRGSAWSPHHLVWDAKYEDSRSIPELDRNAQKDLDLILGADITFDASLMPDLARTLSHLLFSNARARALVSATIRNKETFQSFVEACRAERLTLTTLDFSCPDNVMHQAGLFHSHQIPIQIVELIRDFSTGDIRSPATYT